MAIAATPRYSGQITWRNRGEVTGLDRLPLESGDCGSSTGTRRMLARADISDASGTGFHAHRAGAGVASFTAVRASAPGCAGACGRPAIAGGTFADGSRTTAFRPSPRVCTGAPTHRLEQLDERLADRWFSGIAAFLEWLNRRSALRRRSLPMLWSLR
jgi:hypothetical protein